eukprot:1069118-Prymnesium_polylepis.1
MAGSTQTNPEFAVCYVPVTLRGVAPKTRGMLQYTFRMQQSSTFSDLLQELQGACTPIVGNTPILGRTPIVGMPQCTCRMQQACSTSHM